MIRELATPVKKNFTLKVHKDKGSVTKNNAKVTDTVFSKRSKNEKDCIGA